MNLRKILRDLKEKREDKKAKKSKYGLYVYFGIPGAGKSTMAAWIARNSVKHGRKVYSNYPIKGCYHLDCKNDLGIYHIEESDIIIDEVGLEYSNRDYKTFPQESRYFFKYHRHYKDNVYIFSQSYDDMDITLRRLAKRYYIMQPFMFGLILRREIAKKIDINDMTNEICDKYYFVHPFLGGWKFIYSPSLFKLFDSYSFKQLKEKEFRKWDDMSEGEKLLIQ